MTRTFLGVVGISTLLVAMPLSAASAENLAVNAPPPPPQSPVDSWTGFYAGIVVGGAFGSSNQIDNGPFDFGPTTPGYKVTGALAGGTVGYNWQRGNWVWGLEGDTSWANVSGGAHEMAPFTTSTFVDTKENWLATGRARLGWSTENNILFYATGGIAAASVTADIVETTRSGGALTLTDARTRWGGAIGAGVETKLTSNWSFKAEYLYAKFQSDGYFSEPLPGRTNTRSDVPLDNNLFRFGINYALNGAPARAADMEVKARPAAPAPVYSWTGFYIGDNAGYSWSKVTTTTTATCAGATSGYFCQAGNSNGLANIPAINADGSGSFSNNTFTGGAQAGYNWQTGNLVVGLEADVEAYRAQVTTAVSRIYPGNPSLTYIEGTNVTTDWLSTWRGRLGWANDKVLVYGTGGAALTDLRVGDTFSDNDGAGAVGGSNTSKLKVGWAVGAGLEYLLWRNWTIRGEYLYVDLGSVSTATTVTNPSLPGLSNPLSITGKVTGSISRAALNYRF